MWCIGMKTYWKPHWPFADKTDDPDVLDYHISVIIFSIENECIWAGMTTRDTKHWIVNLSTSDLVEDDGGLRTMWHCVYRCEAYPWRGSGRSRGRRHRGTALRTLRGWGGGACWWSRARWRLGASATGAEGCHTLRGSFGKNEFLPQLQVGTSTCFIETEGQ